LPRLPEEGPPALSTPHPTARQVAIGIGLMVLATFGFSVMSGLVKAVSPPIPTVQVLFFRAAFAMVPLMLVIMLTGGPRQLRTMQPQGHVVRSLAGLIGSFCYFYAYGHMPLADVVAISFSMPLFATALAVPLLGETVRIRRWTAILVGFAGVLVMVRPGGSTFTPVALIMVAGAALYAVASIAIRKMSATETSASIVFYFTLTSMVASAVALPWVWVTPSGKELAFLVMVGLIGGVAQICMTRAFGAAALAIIAPFEYASLLWSVGIGWMFWGEVPDWAVGVGAMLVVGSGLYILHRETVLRRDPTAQYDPAAKSQRGP
jgi:drug/metabolite transporter (DMT)-like permease